MWRKRAGEIANWSDGVVRNFGALAGLANSGPSVAVFLDGWPHERWETSLAVALVAGWLRECRDLNI